MCHRLRDNKHNTMLYLLVVSMMSCLFTGVLSRSVPFVPPGCYKAFTFENECTSQINTNRSDHSSFAPLHSADTYMDDVCRVFGEYRKCIEEDYTYLKINCPSGFVTFADAVIRYYTPTCKTYKADQEAFLTCFSNNREFRDEVYVCWHGISEKANVEGIEYITDCRFVDDLIKCFDGLNQCNQPQHFTRLMKYLKETSGDACYMATTLMKYMH